MSLLIKDSKISRRKSIPRRASVRKRPLTTSPTTQTSESANTKRRRNKSQVSAKSASLIKSQVPEELESWLEIAEVEVTDISQIDTNCTVGAHSLITLEDKEKRQVNDSGKPQNGETSFESISNLLGEIQAVSGNDGMNEGSGRTLPKNLENLADKLKKISDITEENEILTGYISDDGESARKPMKGDHTYCSTPVAKQSVNGLVEGLETKPGDENKTETGKDFAKENNVMLHLVMDTLLTVNKNLRRNNETLSSFEGRMNAIEGKVNASIAVIKTQMTEQEAACFELIDKYQKDKAELINTLDVKKAELEHKFIKHRAEIDTLVTDKLCSTPSQAETNEKLNSLLDVKLDQKPLAKKSDIIRLKEEMDKLDMNVKNQVSECINQKIKSLPGLSKDELDKVSKRIKSLESSLNERVNTAVTSKVGNVPLATKSDLDALSSISKFHTEKLGEAADSLLKLDSHGKKIEERQAKDDGRVKSCEDKIKDLERSIIELHQKNASLKETHEEKLKEIDTMLRDNLSFKSPDETTQVTSHFQCPSFQRKFDEYCKKTDKCCARIDKINYKVDCSIRYSQTLDARTRKNNVIIDQLNEGDNEDTLAVVNQILNHTLSVEERAEVTIGRAYRLGTKPRDSKSFFTRKVFVEFASPRSKDVVMMNTRKITKSGNNGRPYYITDDIPDSIKRRRSDLHKHFNYLKQKGREVEKVGEDLIIDGQRWCYSDLNRLPTGDRIMDSRMISNSGVLAFQSAQAPLSNLFPCEIRCDGLCFSSLEQAYQYRRAIHHMQFNTAQLILYQDDPYDIMAQMKDFRDDHNWLNKRVSIMEELVKHKAEQVDIFKETLKRTADLSLVENTWNGFWGSGCAWLAGAVWYKQFTGQNQLGLLLERIRGTI